MVGDGESLPKGMEKGREQKIHEDSLFTSQNWTKTENEGLHGSKHAKQGLVSSLILSKSAVKSNWDPIGFNQFALLDVQKRIW